MQMVGHGVDILLLNVYYTDADGKPDKRNLATFLVEVLKNPLHWWVQTCVRHAPRATLRPGREMPGPGGCCRRGSRWLSPLGVG